MEGVRLQQREWRGEAQDELRKGGRGQIT